MPHASYGPVQAKENHQQSFLVFDQNSRKKLTVHHLE